MELEINRSPIFTPRALLLPMEKPFADIDPSQIPLLREALLAWYHVHARSLPWRATYGQRQDPYKVWLSEIMLQQTTVKAVIPYFLDFTTRWPRVEDLAAAPEEEILRRWAGLGYYARARNLHACAREIAHACGGVFPQSESGLRKLSGIGPYTASAIAAIAFDHPAVVIDGNIERIVSRLFAIDTPLPEGKKTIRTAAHTLMDGRTDRPGDFAQALMDLGSGICVPASPHCTLCPLAPWCAGFARGIAHTLPTRIKAPPKPERTGSVYWIEDGQGGVLLHRRPARGLLGGMMGLPTSEWLSEGVTLTPPPALSGLSLRDTGAHIVHVFTHFRLTLHCYAGFLPPTGPLPDHWNFYSIFHIATAGLPSVFQKVARERERFVL